MQIILKLTTECNLNCSYCSEGDKIHEVMREELYFKLIDDVPALCTDVGDNKIDILFHGGEPMLYGREKIKRMVNYAREKLSEFEIRFLIQTNGTLINNEWIEFFIEEGISPGISLDGYPEIHDKFRRDKSGKTTAEIIISNMKKMHKAGLQFGTLMVMNSVDDIDVEKLFNFICDNDINIKIHPMIPCGRAEGRKDSLEIYNGYIEVMMKLLELALKNNMKNCIQPIDELLDAIIGLSPLSECSFNGSCGKKFICLYPDGEVGFCGRAGKKRELLYGNIMDSSLLDLYYSASAQRLRDRQKYLREHDCMNCLEWELCHGGCAFEALNAFGTLEAKYINCKGRKKFLQDLRTRGVVFLKEALVREKIKHRNNLNNKKKVLRNIDDIKLDEVMSNARNVP